MENPFSDAVPTHFAIVATVYTKPLTELASIARSNRSKLVLAPGSYGTGKSHALERLKNDINTSEKQKLAIYCSAFATKSLRSIYEQVCSELSSGKIDKIVNMGRNRSIMENRGLPTKIIDIFYAGSIFRPPSDIKADLSFGKIVSSSSDVIHFLCALSALVDQFVLLMDDIEEATTLERGERKTFFGHIRALYDEAVRKDLNMLIVMTLTLDKVQLLMEDRMDLYERVDKAIEFGKPTFKEFSEIIQKRLEISALDDIKFEKGVLKKVWDHCDNIRGMLNILRDLLDNAYERGEATIKNVELPKKTPSVMSSYQIRTGYKPADDLILKILRDEKGLPAEGIIVRSKRSGSWIRHRLADLVTAGVLRKEQTARNKPAQYYLVEEKEK